MRHAFGASQPIEPGQQRLVEGGGNGQRWHRPGRRVLRLDVGRAPRLQHRFGHLFDKQGDAIGLGHNLLQHRGGQALPPQHLPDHRLGLGRG